MSKRLWEIERAPSWERKRQDAGESLEIQVDETAKEEVKPGLRPEVAGKIVTQALPGITLVRYPSGYSALRMQRQSSGGPKATVGKALYKAELTHLAILLLKEADKCVTYEQAHGLESPPCEVHRT